MVYILCEGEEGKADYSFCEAIIKLYCQEYKLVSSRGNRNIVGTFKSEIVPKMKTGDKFALFFDSVESISRTPTEDILEEIAAICQQKNVAFYHTTYYCMEEIFISYSCFMNMIARGAATPNTQLLNALNFAYKNLNNGINYYQIANQNADLMKFIKDNEYTTREQCSKGLCYEISPMLGKLYKVTTKYIGDCWIYDCDDIRNRRKNSAKCQSCVYNKICETFKQKLDYMEEKINTTFWSAVFSNRGIVTNRAV